ncbi:MAG: Ig-like domain-containing protein [Actinomycetota bacterium]
MRRIAVTAVLAALAVVPVGARADDPFPQPVEQAGLALTMNVAETYRPGVPLGVSGRLVAAFALTIVVEVALPVPNAPIEIVVDGETAAQTQTNTEGFYNVDLMFDASAPTHTIQAYALRGTLVQTPSDPVEVRRERILTDLQIRPAVSSVPVGGARALSAVALDGDGREVIVTEEAAWSSSDPAVATVSNADGTRGLVTGVAPGTATITAMIEGLTATARVDVV